MRMRRLPEVAPCHADSPARGAALLATVLLVSGRAAPTSRRAGPPGWESLLGDRPSAQLGGRWIVMLAKPSLATRVAAAGGLATEEQERELDGQARRDQRDVIARLAFRGAPIEPEHSYTRIFNGFATPLDARSLAIVQRDPDVRGVFPVRTAIPAGRDPDAIDEIVDAAGGRRPDLGIPGFDGARRDRRAARHRGRPRPPVHSRARCSAASTCSTRSAMRARARTRPLRAGPSGTAPRWRVSSPASRRAGRPAGRRAGSRAPAHPRRRLAARRVGRGLRLRPHRPAAGRDRARSRPERGR